MLMFNVKPSLLGSWLPSHKESVTGWFGLEGILKIIQILTQFNSTHQIVLFLCLNLDKLGLILLIFGGKWKDEFYFRIINISNEIFLKRSGIEDHKN